MLLPTLNTADPEQESAYTRKQNTKLLEAINFLLFPLFFKQSPAITDLNIPGIPIIFVPLQLPFLPEVKLCQLCLWPKLPSAAGHCNLP